MISANEAVVITGVFKNRWRTLMVRRPQHHAGLQLRRCTGSPPMRVTQPVVQSVDDVIGDVIAACQALGVADKTYFFYTSE